MSEYIRLRVNTN
uniref:Uncharacterized protein n=1 Tax=Anguilla anguilla TaxID=7936 RepID=A0A0E9RJ01_ANGAN